MDKKLFLIFNHEITGVQEKDAVNSLGVGSIVALPDDLKALWSNVPPDLQEIRSYLQPVMDWLEKNADKDDYVLVQGDFGACYLMVQFCFEKGLVPVYSTTRREAVEKHLPDGSISLKHVFRHRIFRIYEG